MKNKIIIISILAAFVLNSCIHTKFEEPEFDSIPVGQVLTIEQLYQIYNDSARMAGKTFYKFTEDYSV